MNAHEIAHSQKATQTDQNPPSTPQGQRFNAMKHGHYAESLFIPGEDPLEFARERRGLFHNYRPQTLDEAALVHTMAVHAWIKRRVGAQQARFDAQLLAPEEDAAGRVCEPVAHQRLHSGLDVSARWRRVEALWHRARAQLLEVQKLRRQGLIEGAIRLPEDCYMETDGAVYGPVTVQAIVPLPEPQIGQRSDGLSASADTAPGFSEEQKETGNSNPGGMRQVELRMLPEPTGWAAFPGEIVVLGVVQDALFPQPLAA
ncbi:MAG TPA: hypothetical protein VF678_06005 [bacterium]